MSATSSKSVLYPQSDDDSVSDAESDSETEFGDSNVKLKGISATRLCQTLPLCSDKDGGNEFEILRFCWKRAYISKKQFPNTLCIPPVDIPVTEFLHLPYISEVTVFKEGAVEEDSKTLAPTLQKQDSTVTNVVLFYTSLVRDRASSTEQTDCFLHGNTKSQWDCWWNETSIGVRNENNDIWQTSTFWEKVLESSIGTGCADFCFFTIVPVYMCKRSKITEQLNSFLLNIISKSSLSFLSQSQFSETLLGLKLRSKHSHMGALLELHLARCYHKCKGFQ